MSRPTRATASPSSNTFPAGPSGAATESTMFTPSTVRLTPEQRERFFFTGLELERAMVEVEQLRARLNAELDQAQANMREQHAQLMHAAMTGEEVSEPVRQRLPLKARAPASPRRRNAAPAPTGEQPPTAPRKRGRPPKVRPAEVTGEVRLAPAESGHTARETQENLPLSTPVAVAPAPVADVPEEAVPPPLVPCCECGDSLADHEDGTGACQAVHAGGPCECKAFRLHRVKGWELVWGEWQGRRAFWLTAPPSLPMVSHGPLMLEEDAKGARLVLPSAPASARDVLAVARAAGTWPALARNGVPMDVLELVVRVLRRTGGRAS